MTVTITDEFSNDKIELLKNTICKGISGDQFEIFLHVCRRTGLDPFRNQIYAVPRAGKMTIQTGIDGFRLIAERTGKYAPGKEPTYTYDAQGKLVSATTYLKKQTADGTWHEVSATAFWNEYVQAYNGKPSQFWAKMPHLMLAKCSESLCLRKAFPADFSGIYTTEEMAQADAEVVTVKDENPQMNVDEYISKNWQGLEKEFKVWMASIAASKGWDEQKCIEAFIANPDYTKKTFMASLEAK